MGGQAPPVPDIRVTLLGRFAGSVGGGPVAETVGKRRHAAAVVKVLALAPGRRLHREQVIDLVWPGDTIAEAVGHAQRVQASRPLGQFGAVAQPNDTWSRPGLRSSNWSLLVRSGKPCSPNRVLLPSA